MKAETIDQITLNISSARGILDLIATLEEHKGCDGLLKGTLTNACLTAIDHLDAAAKLAEGAPVSSVEAQS